MPDPPPAPSTDRPRDFTWVLVLLGLLIVAHSLLSCYWRPLLEHTTQRTMRPYASLADNLLTTLALLGLFLWTRSRLWLAAAVTMAGLTASDMAVSLTHAPQDPLSWWVYLNGLAQSGGAVLFGCALLLRRGDGPRGIAVAAGIALVAVAVLSMLAWSMYFAVFELRLSQTRDTRELLGLLEFLFRSGVDVINALLIGFFGGVLLHGRTPPALTGGAARVLLRVGAVGALLLAAAWAGFHHEMMDFITRPRALPPTAYALAAFAGLFLLGSVLLGVGYLGQTFLSGSYTGIAAAMLIWLHPVVTAVTVLLVGRGAEKAIWGVGTVGTLVGALSILSCSRVLGHRFGIATSILLSVSTMVGLLVTVGAIGYLTPGVSPTGDLAKTLFTGTAFLYVAGYLMVGLYQLWLADHAPPPEAAYPAPPPVNPPLLREA